MRLRTYYSSAYSPPEVPTLARLAVAADDLHRRDLVDLIAPPAFDRESLRGLHDPEYLDAFDRGIAPAASSQGIRWSPVLRDATYAMLSGQLEAAHFALEHGIAMNLARGFHHAVYERGAGFCPINGFALIAQRMPNRRVFVLDCDEHGGNGTEEYAARMPNLFNASIFGTRFGCVGGVRSWAFEVRVPRDGFAAYRDALDRVFAEIERQRPDFVIYQAGTDCHVSDPKGRTGLSTRRMAERDLRVFATLRRLGIPTLIVVGGGYQTAAAVATLNRNTVTAALRCESRG